MFEFHVIQTSDGIFTTVQYNHINPKFSYTSTPYKWHLIRMYTDSHLSSNTCILDTSTSSEID